MAKWALYTEAKQGDVCSWAMSLNAININIGDVVKIMDNDYATDTGTYLAGRALSSTGTTVNLGCPITIEAGHTYHIGITNLAGDDIIERTITSPPGVVTSVQIDSALPVGDYSNKEFFCYSTGLVEPRLFRIVSIEESERGKFTFSSQFYDPDKYGVIEENLSVVPHTYTHYVTNNIPAVSNIVFREIFMNDGIASHNYIDVTFDFDTSIKDPITFTGRWRRDNGVYTNFQDTSLREFRIPDTTPGVYDVIIEANNIAGIKSLPTISTYNYRTSAANSTLVAPIPYVTGTTGRTFYGQNISISWEFPAENAYKTDTLLDYIVKVFDGVTEVKSYVVQPGSAKGGSFNYLYEMNMTDHNGTATRSVSIAVYSRDMIGDLSTATIYSYTNAAPAAPIFNLINGIGNVYVNITPVEEADVKGYRIWRSTTASFTKDNSTLVYDGPDNYVSLAVPTSETYYYAVAAFDLFGKDNLNISSELSGTPLSVDSTRWTMSGITFSAVANVLSWTSGTIVRNGTTSYSIAAGTATWTTGTMYVYFDPTVSTTVLQTTTTLAIAVGANAYPLATFTGGGSSNIKGGDGSAFINGSQVIAGTVGASQLVAGSAVITGAAQLGSAVITAAAIQDGAITNAKIGNTIQSTNYSSAGHTGWQIDKAGNLTSYGATSLYDASGNVILTTGASAAIEWGKIANKTGFASISSINSGNVSTYIANGAIGNAQIGDASISNAKIVNASVDYLKIQGNSVTVPIATYNAGPLTNGGGTICALGLPVLPEDTNYIVNIGGDCSISMNSAIASNAVNVTLTDNAGNTYYAKSWVSGTYNASIICYYTVSPGAKAASVLITVPANTYKVLYLNGIGAKATNPSTGGSASQIQNSYINAVAYRR